MVTGKVRIAGALVTRRYQRGRRYQGDAVPVEVRLPNILRPLASGEASVEAEGATLRDVFGSLVLQYPELRPSLLGPDGEMHRHLNVFLNDDDVRYLGKLDTKVGEDDVVTLMPAVAGG
jgi:molybdopterin converting factor small subunit